MNIAQILLFLVVFLIPTNLFLKFGESSAYVNGLFIDYLLPKLYLSDIFILAFVGWWLWSRRKVWLKLSYWRQLALKLPTIFKKNWLWFLFFIFFATRQLFSSHPLASLWYLAKITEISMFFFVIFQIKDRWKMRAIMLATKATLFFQSSLAIFQFYYQRSLAGYHFLGEPNLNQTIGLTKEIFNGVEKILPYGTTAHPNILGGVLVIFLLAHIGFLQQKLRRNKPSFSTWIDLLIVLFAGLAILLTWSFSAWLALGLGIITITLPINHKTMMGAIVAITLLTPIVLSQSNALFSLTNQSFVRRNYLNQASLNMIVNNPILGVGLNNFTAQVEKYSTEREVVRFIQPVHHTLLLLISEVGLIFVVVLGTKSFAMCHKKSKEKRNKYYSILIKTALIITPLAAFDHYLISNQVGLLLLGYVALTTNFLEPHQI